MNLASKGFVLTPDYTIVVAAGTRSAVVELVNESAGDVFVCLGSVPTDHSDSFAIPAGKSYFTSAPSENIISASGTGKLVVITDFSQ